MIADDDDEKRSDSEMDRGSYGDDWHSVLKELDSFLRQPSALQPNVPQPEGGGGSGTTTSSTSTSTSSSSTPSSSMPARAWQSAKSGGGAKPGISLGARPGTGPSTSSTGSGHTTTTTTTTTSDTGAKSVGLQKSRKPGGVDLVGTMNNEAMNRAFQNFDELFASRVKQLAVQDGYLKTRAKFREQALQSPKALTPEAAEELVAKFWVEVLWHGSPPLIEPTPERRDDIRNQLALQLIKIRKGVKMAGVKVGDGAPIVAFFVWSRDCLIGMSDAGRYKAFLDGPVRSEVAKALQDYRSSGQKKQTLFREGVAAQLAFGANIAFHPILSRIQEKFDGFRFDSESREGALSQADVARYRQWIRIVPNFFAKSDKTQLEQLVSMMAEEVLKALPNGSAPGSVLDGERKSLLVRCLQAAFIRASVVLGLQGSPLIQTRNHAMGRLFCASLISTLFNAAALIAAKEDPHGALLKKFEVEPFDDALLIARAVSEAIALEIGVLVDAALDAAKSSPP